MKSTLQTINEYALNDPAGLVEKAENHYDREITETASYPIHLAYLLPCQFVAQDIHNVRRRPMHHMCFYIGLPVHKSLHEKIHQNFCCHDSAQHS